jgi:DNA helicase HerA-like ATPase
VGVYFVTQNPLDIPEKVLGQLGNRVQHALRAFTPRDQKAVKAVAETMRANPKLDLERAILELGVGEALISLLDAKGAPTVTERAWVLPPSSQIGPITPEERKQLIASSPVAGVYEKTVDRESAFELLRKRAETAPTPAAGTAGGGGATAGGGFLGSLGDTLFGSTGPRGGRREGLVDALAKSAARSVGSAIAREITRGVLGSLLGGRRR